MKARILNLGAGKHDYLPLHYQQFDVTTLDFDPEAEPDILHDGRELLSLPGQTFNGVVCLHNLEHYYAHEVPAVLAGIYHLLLPGGFVEIAVPDILSEFKRAAANGYGLNEQLFTVGDGRPLTLLDVIYGDAHMVAHGRPGYAHKTGFSQELLAKHLADTGFERIKAFTQPPHVFSELWAYGWKPLTSLAASESPDIGPASAG